MPQIFPFSGSYIVLFPPMADGLETLYSQHGSRLADCGIRVL